MVRGSSDDLPLPQQKPRQTGAVPCLKQHWNLLDLFLVGARSILVDNCLLVVSQKENRQDFRRIFSRILAPVGHVHGLQQAITCPVDFLADTFVENRDLTFQDIGEQRRLVLMPACFLARVHRDDDCLDRGVFLREHHFLTGHSGTAFKHLPNLFI